MKQFFHALIRPKVFVPLALTAGLLTALFSFANLGVALTIMSGFQRSYLLYFLLLMIGYELVRGAQWSYSLRQLRLNIPLRKQIFAFALSEVTKALPIGNYFQNYILKLEGEADFSRSSVATTLIVFEEVFICLVGVVALGLGSWTWWARVTILAGLALVAALVWLYRRNHSATRRPPAWLTRHRRFRSLADGYVKFRESASDMLTPRALLVTLGFSAAYLTLAGLGLYVVARGLNITSVNVGEALAVYGFSLAMGLLIPIPVDIGVIELTGLGAFLAVGVGRNAALSAMLANRLLSIVASLALALIVVAALRDEAPTLFKRGKQRTRQPVDQPHATQPGEAAESAGV